MNTQQNLPLISVYMPTFNRVGMAMRAIDSVLAQDYPNIELLVVDDASTDDTWPSLTNKYVSDERVRFFRQSEGKGACAARNRAINEAKGEFVTGIDDDDEFLPHRLSSLYQAYDAQYSCVCSAYIWDYGSVRKTLFASEEVVTLSSLLDLHSLSNQALVPRERMLQLHGFDEGLAAFQDYDMWVLQLLQHCRFGLQALKWRYYLKQKLAWLSDVRIRLLSKGLIGFFKK